MQPTTGASRGNLSIKRGAVEIKFLQEIKLQLNDIIFFDMVPKFDFNLNKNTYNPDFTLICKQTNLHIDIEIDEPYTLKEKLPIHYIGSTDDDRNDFFLSINWCVIRFSERQIIENSVDCIATIKSVHKNIVSLKSYYKNNVISNKRWTYEDSLIMSKYRERELQLLKL